MQDLTLDFQNKKIENKFIKRKELVLQKVTLALQCWLGDWYLDGLYGIPYGIRFNNRALLIADAKDIMLGVEGVVSIQDLTADIITIDGKKIFNISATVLTDQEQEVVYNDIIPIVGV